MILARPFDFPYDGKLVPARTALLVIDLQIDFLSETGGATTLRRCAPSSRRSTGSSPRRGPPAATSSTPARAIAATWPR
jgi:nicotinamidase-related amidase